MATVSNDTELEAAIKKDIKAAIQEANHLAFQVLVDTVTAFYSGNPKKYVRTGQLLQTPRTAPMFDGMGFWAGLDDEGTYSYATGSRPTMGTVLGWAENGEAGVIGRLRWDDAARQIIDYTDATLHKYFS